MEDSVRTSRDHPKPVLKQSFEGKVLGSKPLDVWFSLCVREEISAVWGL